MPNNDENIQKTEKFIRDTLQHAFGQEIDAETLEKAAEKLRLAMPSLKSAVAA
jgi:hypothetical protein